MLFINTRPTERANALTRAVKEMGVDVIELPLLTLTPLDLSVDLKEKYQQLPRASTIVVVSPIAVEVGMQYLAECQIACSNLDHIHWISVGETTAEALGRHGISSYIPEIETSEGMLELPILKNLDVLQTVAFWRGIGGRQFMMQHLIEQGHQVLNFELYTRGLPDSTVDQYVNDHHILKKHHNKMVLITSEASWQHWLQLNQNMFAIDAFSYMVLGTRLQQILLHYQQEHSLNFNVMMLENLKPHNIIQIIKKSKGTL